MVRFHASLSLKLSSLFMLFGLNVNLSRFALHSTREEAIQQQSDIVCISNLKSCLHIFPDDGDRTGILNVL
jgi:hypothetical protein